MAERGTRSRSSAGRTAGAGGAGRARPTSPKAPATKPGPGSPKGVPGTPKSSNRPRSSATKGRGSSLAVLATNPSPSPEAAETAVDPAAADPPAYVSPAEDSEPPPPVVTKVKSRRKLKRFATFTEAGVTFAPLDETDDTLEPVTSFDLENVPRRRSQVEIAIPLPKLEEGEGSNNIKVCVRVRPFNSRELELQSKPQSCVSMPSKTEVVLEAIPADAIEEGSHAQAERKFEYDRAYLSMDPKEPDFSSQQTLMDEIGQELKSNVLHGYNSCIFAYGQTGSGKTFSILGADNPPELKGLLPRIVQSIFETVAQLNTGVEIRDRPVCTCHLTYLEIYNEQLRDLLVPPGDTPAKLVISSSPTMGVIVQGIKEIPVFTGDDVINWLDMGTRARTVGQTCMNAQSSRSHCVFTLEIHRTSINDAGVTSELHSKFVSVDLAGSERQSKTHASGARLKEGAKINQSLTNLAIVINKLAEASDRKGRPSGDHSHAHVPFRNSKLTYVLQNSLSGNSKTVMMAAISPSANNWEESLSTLNFAKSVKKIKTSAAKNEHSKESIVASLRREIEELKSQQKRDSRKSLKIDEEAEAKTLALEETMSKYGHDFETQLQIAQKHQTACAKALEDMGLNLSEISGALGMRATTPQLVNVSHDPSLQGCLVYFLDRGNRTIRIGSEKGSGGIVLQGLGITHCNAHILNHDDVILSIEAQDGRVIVNGRHITKETGPCPLRNGDRLILGYSFCFRVAIPLALEDVAAQVREWHSLEQALMEVMPGDMEAYENCHLFGEQLQMRLGAEKAQAFLKDFQKLSSLVEEANAITLAVRPDDHLHFDVEVLVDLRKYVTEEPECVVRLKRQHTGIKKLRNVIKQNMLSKKHTDDASTSGRPGAHYSTLAVFDTKAFMLRLEHIREVYELFEAGKELNLERPEHDPWREIPPWEFEHLIGSRGEALSCSSPTSRARVESEANVELEEERAKWLERERVYFSNLKALEQEILVLRSHMATSRDQTLPSMEGAGSAKVMPPEQRKDIVAARAFESPALMSSRSAEFQRVLNEADIVEVLLRDVVNGGGLQSRDDTVLPMSKPQPPPRINGIEGSSLTRRNLPEVVCTSAPGAVYASPPEAVYASPLTEPILGGPPPIEPISGMSAQRADNFFGLAPPRIVEPPPSLLFRQHSTGQISTLAPESQSSWPVITPLSCYSSPVPQARSQVNRMQSGPPSVCEVARFKTPRSGRTFSPERASSPRLVSPGLVSPGRIVSHALGVSSPKSTVSGELLLNLPLSLGRPVLPLSLSGLSSPGRPHSPSRPQSPSRPRSPSRPVSPNRPILGRHGTNTVQSPPGLIVWSSVQPQSNTNCQLSRSQSDKSFVAPPFLQQQWFQPYAASGWAVHPMGNNFMSALG